MVWLPDGEKKLDDIFIRFDTTHERDRHTDRQTHTQTRHDSIGFAYASHRAAKMCCLMLSKVDTFCRAAFVVKSNQIY